MDYKNGKIYAIRSPHTDKVYIGSTTQSLSKRLHHHKRGFKCWKAGKFSYTSSFEILEAGEAYIELVKNCPCNNREELRREEGITIRATDCVNKSIAGRTSRQYREDNREQIIEYQRQYNQENKEQINERQRQYYQENKERQRHYYQENKERQRQYYQENKERQRQYYQENKERIKEKVGCYVCKCMVRKVTFKRHTKSKKHQKNSRLKEKSN